MKAKKKLRTHKMKSRNNSDHVCGAGERGFDTDCCSPSWRKVNCKNCLRRR